MSDVELWRRVSGGNDERALGELYESLADRVFSHARRQSADTRDAEDATAVAFFELWRRRSDVRLVDGSPLPWLLATTTNALRNLRRSSARYRKLLDALPRAALEPTIDEKSVESESIRALLAPLSRVDRQLISLTVLEGYSSNEAASALGLSPGATRTRLSRARSRLRDHHSNPRAIGGESA